MESVDFEIRPTSQQGVASFSRASVSHSVDWLMVPVVVSTRVGASRVPGIQRALSEQQS